MSSLSVARPDELPPERQLATGRHTALGSIDSVDEGLSHLIPGLELADNSRDAKKEFMVWIKQVVFGSSSKEADAVLSKHFKSCSAGCIIAAPSIRMCNDDRVELAR